MSYGTPARIGNFLINPKIHETNMKKRLFQILDEMNIDDAANNTANVALCPDIESADLTKKGGIVRVGIPREAFDRLFMQKGYDAMLMIYNIGEYKRLADLPGEDIEKIREKAAKWDELGDTIATFYGNDDGNEAEDGGPGLDVIGEHAAMAFGFL